MNHVEVRKYWNQNAPVWTSLTRAGYDAYRDYLNTPAFFQLLPAIDGLVGLDIGCGEGHNTRLLARRGAHVAAVDIQKFLFSTRSSLRQESHSVSTTALRARWHSHSAVRELTLLLAS